MNIVHINITDATDSLGRRLFATGRISPNPARRYLTLICGDVKLARPVLESLKRYQTVTPHAKGAA